MQSTTTIKFKRRRQAATNYRKRLGLVKSGLDRVVVRKTNSRIIGQVVSYSEVGDKVKAAVDSNMLKRFGWPSRPNRPTAYLTGMLLAQRARAGSIDSECVLDIGLSASKKGSIPFIFAKGCVDNGMKLRGTFDAADKLYNGSGTASYAAKAGGSQFAAYKAQKFELESMPEAFARARDEIKKAK